MKFSTLLTPNNTLCQVECASKKSALEIISHLAAKKLSIDSQTLFNSLISRERIGSTGIGLGVAIPHVKIDKSLPATAIFLQFVDGIDFDAIDGKKVDILFAVFVPEDQCDKYLAALSDVSQQLLEKRFLRQLRCAKDSETLFSLLDVTQ
ncbi:MAG TPA: PTS IIA-like nitrogen regulatory protein PtsN [Psychromonas hadalis]|nr:PTS IIA-like nitrogen regulatory protein PtsN [Psychromonas hadalis]